MTKANVSLILHLFINTAFQGAVVALVPAGDHRDLIQGILTLLGVIVAFYDTSHADLKV